MKVEHSVPLVAVAPLLLNTLQQYIKAAAARPCLAARIIVKDMLHRLRFKLKNDRVMYL